MCTQSFWEPPPPPRHATAHTMPLEGKDGTVGVIRPAPRAKRFAISITDFCCVLLPLLKCCKMDLQDCLFPHAPICTHRSLSLALTMFPTIPNMVAGHMGHRFSWLAHSYCLIFTTSLQCNSVLFPDCRREGEGWGCKTVAHLRSPCELMAAVSFKPGSSWVTFRLSVTPLTWDYAPFNREGLISKY